jgi:hypothetical protein
MPLAMNEKLQIEFKKISYSANRRFQKASLTFDKLEWVTTAPLKNCKSFSIKMILKKRSQRR